jgi:hypothetical protein
MTAGYIQSFRIVKRKAKGSVFFKPVSPALSGADFWAYHRGMSNSIPERDVKEMFAAALAAGRVGSAQKIKPVDARQAKPEEVIVTMIAGIKETESKPARSGDMVVRNRSPETGNEEMLVAAEEFAKRYRAVDGSADKRGWKEYRPIATEMSYFIVSKAEGSFRFIAPWGKEMIAEVGDVIIQNPENPDDTYRVAAKAFKNTYVIKQKPQSRG